MKCTDFIKVIDDYQDGELSAEGQVRCDLHLTTCTTCNEALVDVLALQAALRKLPVEGPSEGFADRALRRAVAQNVGQHHRHGFLVGFGSAAAAALALWVVVGFFPQDIPVEGTGDYSVAQGSVAQGGAPMPEVTIALSQQRDIKLAFHSAVELKGARIRIQLPENVALVGFPGQRELDWETNLAKGDNLLSLPVVATRAARGGQLVARIEHAGKIRTLKVNLEMGSPDLTRSIEVTPKVV
jgi:hypothetical protein